MGETQSTLQKIDLTKKHAYDPNNYPENPKQNAFQELDINQQTHFVNEILKQKFNDFGNKGKSILQFLKEKGYLLTDQILGKGGFGMVVKGYSVPLKKYVAIKIIKFKTQKQFFDNLLEFNNQQDLKQKNILQSIQIMNFNELQIQFIVMDLCKTDLVEYLNYFLSQKKWLKNLEILQLWLQLVQGLKYLHSQNILHLDIKPANILLGIDNFWKYNDFGLSFVLRDGQESTTDTKGFTSTYSSPEQYLLHQFKVKTPISKESDIYSLGLVFLLTTKVILSKETLIKLKLDSNLLAKCYNDEYSDLNEQIIKKMLKTNPQKRITLDQLESVIQENIQILENKGNYFKEQINVRNKSLPSLDIEKITKQNQLEKNKSQSQIEKIQIYYPSKRVLTNREYNDQQLQSNRQQSTTASLTPLKLRRKVISNPNDQNNKNQSNNQQSFDSQVDLVQLGADKKMHGLPYILENNLANRSQGYLNQNTVTITQTSNKLTKNDYQFQNQKIQNLISKQKNEMEQNIQSVKNRYLSLQTNKIEVKSQNIQKNNNSFLPKIYQNRAQINLQNIYFDENKQQKFK
ncbi:Serine/Threonine kinase domain protein (macronuclear) [Tetrahymena thermophila SB210]|uniref:Serine/Threonine kinase domain protein n=1 Tax=Tetrahymena thermophila (strain SB210) TaxID=312017 RepID=I7MGH4_TETTS|nr:Serine/Threonine kinase domain protein [Tetrahymena thermophila SB210]EAR85167.2 Serine/Threonine kinase domain protein [Tetrahymena thermophila SB210]|eukprot:XP_001032830.2 Serine/Threonine kinase domain protein [Tetrahymena thermophila SB210]